MFQYFCRDAHIFWFFLPTCTCSSLWFVDNEIVSTCYFIAVPKKLSSPTCKVIYCYTWLQMLALDVELEAFETLKVAHCLAKQCLSFYFVVGCGGSRGLKWASRSRWRLRRKLSPSRPSLCIESVPVRPLSQFPPLLNIGPETTVVVAGWVCPQVRSPLLSHFFRGRVSKSDWVTALQGSLLSPQHLMLIQEQAHDAQRGISVPSGLYVWSDLCRRFWAYNIYIQVSGRSAH